MPLTLVFAEVEGNGEKKQAGFYTSLWKKKTLVVFDVYRVMTLLERDRAG